MKPQPLDRFSHFVGILLLGADIGALTDDAGTLGKTFIVLLAIANLLYAARNINWSDTNSAEHRN